MVDTFRLTTDDVVIDLGCGTGQLALPIAGRVRAVACVDPEPDMLARARQAAHDQGIANVCWMTGADTDIPAIGALLGRHRAGAVTIGQALHWMCHDDLFQALTPLLRPGGGVAVITNGTPLWQQDSDWSQALHVRVAILLGRASAADPRTQPGKSDDTTGAARSTSTKPDRHRSLPAGPLRGVTNCRFSPPPGPAQAVLAGPPESVLATVASAVCLSLHLMISWRGQ